MSTGRNAARRPPKSGRPEARRPYGGEEVTDAIINATVSLWTSEGPAGISLRKIAARAGVNYGLVYRHFGTKDAVIRAALERHDQVRLGYIEQATTLSEAMDTFLGESTGAFARLLAWANVQGVTEEAWPDDYPALDRLRELASSELVGDLQPDDDETKVLVGSLMAMMYGWRFFEPFLVKALDLQHVDRREIDEHVRKIFAAIITCSFEERPAKPRARRPSRVS